MSSRFRFASALFALLALSLFWTEGVWASMCPPETRTEAASPMPTGDEHPDSCPTGDPDGAPAESGTDAGSPHCPLVPPGATSCVGTVALPAAGGTSLVGPPAVALPAPPPDPARGTLLAVALLRPPSA